MRQVLVTGGAGGIGEAIVRRFHALGHPVAFTHVGQKSQADALCAELGASATSFESDTSQEKAVQELHQQVQPLILVHCAGIARDRAIWKQDFSDFEAVLAVNLHGAWLQARASVPRMREENWGRIILIGSINGTRGKFGQTAYASSKAGLHGLSKSLAKELGAKGVTCNLVEPGWIETPMTMAVPPEFQEEARTETVTKRLGKPEDVADAVAFFASDGARHLTGNVLRVDGGQSL